MHMKSILIKIRKTSRSPSTRYCWRCRCCALRFAFKRRAPGEGYDTRLEAAMVELALGAEVVIRRG
jgi:hypothetical protein